MLGSISSHFVRPRSFAHTTAGSLVCPIVFSTNQSLACTNRAGKSLIGEFNLVNNKDGGYLRGGIFCYLLNPFLSCSRLENLGNTSKSTRLLTQRRRCVINTASAIRKVHIFCCVILLFILRVNQLLSQFVLGYLSFHFVDARSTRHSLHHWEMEQHLLVTNEGKNSRKFQRINCFRQVPACVI